MNKKERKSTHTPSDTSKRVARRANRCVFFSLEQSQKRYGIEMEIVSGNSLAFLVNTLRDWKAICEMMKYHEFKGKFEYWARTLSPRAQICIEYMKLFIRLLHQFITWSFSLSFSLALFLPVAERWVDSLRRSAHCVQYDVMTKWCVCMVTINKISIVIITGNQENQLNCCCGFCCSVFFSLTLTLFAFKTIELFTQLRSILAVNRFIVMSRFYSLPEQIPVTHIIRLYTMKRLCDESSGGIERRSRCSSSKNWRRLSVPFYSLFSTSSTTDFYYFQYFHTIFFFNSSNSLPGRVHQRGFSDEDQFNRGSCSGMAFAKLYFESFFAYRSAMVTRSSSTNELNRVMCDGGVDVCVTVVKSHEQE